MLFIIWLSLFVFCNGNLLYCRCGLDHSDPYDPYANTACKVIQYHEESDGIRGDYTGIKIVNETTCSIDLDKNPAGICRKQVSGHQTSDSNLGYDTPSDKHDHIEITWTCDTKPKPPVVPVLCSSREDLDIYCCNSTNFCNNDICQDENSHHTPLECVFHRDRKMKHLRRVLLVVLAGMILILIALFFIHRRNPQRVSIFFASCCKQWASSSFNTGQIYPGRRRDPTQVDLINNRDDTNGYSTRDTYIIDDSFDDSGSGQGNTICTQRTIARQTRIIERVGNGRYGQVFVGIYNSDQVAVKKFYSKEEASWNREVILYQSQSLAHDNILRFIAADNRDNGTQTELWLITEYHSRGSLFDYLVENSLDLQTCLTMVLSIASGIEHLHKEIQGTLTKKCTIAHRDIKSKNILVKDNLELCIADLGLACFCGSNQTLPINSNSNDVTVGNEQAIYIDRYTSSPGKIRDNPVGTVRYLAPEYLKTDLFNEYLNLTRADIYSSALVFWEILNRTKGYYEDGLVPEYRQPYWDNVPSEPTIDDMALVVTADPPQRPMVPTSYSTKRSFQSGSAPLCVLVELMKECWQETPSARLSALRLKKDLRELENNFRKSSQSTSI